MPYIDGKTMLQHAYHNKYGVGAFSAHNAETILGILEAAEEEKSPVMIQIGQKAIQTLGLKQMKMMVDAFVEDFSIPVCIHLDHSREFDQTVQAIQAGFQSVMFDGSSQSFEDNSKITRKVVDICRALNIGTEGEIGKIGGTEDDISVDEKDALITTTEEALKFVKDTDVDYLAVSIGTAHGIYKEIPNIRTERLKEISDKINRPIVLHGGSDVPDEQVIEAIKMGVSKINVDTELRVAFTKGVQEVYENNSEEYVLANSLGNGKQKVKEKVKEKIQVFNSSGRVEEFDFS